jgi:hypothetical protein
MEETNNPTSQEAGKAVLGPVMWMEVLRKVIAPKIATIVTQHGNDIENRQQLHRKFCEDYEVKPSYSTFSGWCEDLGISFKKKIEVHIPGWREMPRPTPEFVGPMPAYPATPTMAAAGNGGRDDPGQSGAVARRAGAGTDRVPATSPSRRSTTTCPPSCRVGSVRRRSSATTTSATNPTNRSHHDTLRHSRPDCRIQVRWTRQCRHHWSHHPARMLGLVVGEAGCGKSFLLQSHLARTSSTWTRRLRSAAPKRSRHVPTPGPDGRSVDEKGNPVVLDWSASRQSRRS